MSGEEAGARDCLQPTARGGGWGANNTPDVNTSPDVYSSPDGTYSLAMPIPQAKGFFVQGLLPQCLPSAPKSLVLLQALLVPRALPCPRPPPLSHLVRNRRATARDPARTSPVLIGGGMGC